MKKIENTFTVTGFVGKDAEIRSFTSASVARFSLAVGRQEKSGDQTSRVSAFLNFEAWRKNENKGSFDYLAKGTLLTVEGYFKPERWTDKDDIEHNSITMVAVKFYPAAENGAKNNLLLPGQKRPSGRFSYAHCYSPRACSFYTVSMPVPPSIDFPVQS